MSLSRAITNAAISCWGRGDDGGLFNRGAPPWPVPELATVWAAMLRVVAT
eukprot:gene31539-55726_t